MIVVEQEQQENPGEDLPPSDSEDSALDVSDEGEAEEPAKIRLCMQMVPVEAANGAMRGLHTMYDWGSTCQSIGHVGRTWHKLA